MVQLSILVDIDTYAGRQDLRFSSLLPCPGLLNGYPREGKNVLFIGLAGECGLSCNCPTIKNCRAVGHVPRNGVCSILDTVNDLSMKTAFQSIRETHKHWFHHSIRGMI